MGDNVNFLLPVARSLFPFIVEIAQPGISGSGLKGDRNSTILNLVKC
ncbi:hypothetical protein FDUTEX481_10152 [Tolypothrix sp. PCC 7601]|nr:hypothetical protein FDUTEX481_10152 [Tolypothrix sp. PCC 7601]